MKIFNTLTKVNMEATSDYFDITPAGINLYEVRYLSGVSAYFTSDKDKIIQSIMIPEDSFEPITLLTILVNQFACGIVELSKFISTMQTKSIATEKDTKSLLDIKSYVISHKAIKALEDELEILNSVKEKMRSIAPPYDRFAKVYTVFNQVKLETLLDDNELKIREMGDLLFGTSITDDIQNLLVFNRDFGLANIIIISGENEENALLEHLIRVYNITLVEYQDVHKHLSICHQLAETETALFQMGRFVHCETNKILERINKMNTPKANNNLVDPIDDLPF